MLSVSERTLFSLTKPNGPIPFVRISRGGKRYALSDLQRFIDEQRRG